MSELQQNRQEKEIDFEKRLKTTDEELKKIKENIFLARENILKKKAEVEQFPKEVLLFNGKWLQCKVYVIYQTRETELNSRFEFVTL